VAASLGLRLGRVDQAAEHLRAGYAQALLTQDRPILAAVGGSVANWAWVLGFPRDAAVLLGAATRLRGTEDRANPLLVEVVDGVRAALGEEFDVAYAEGLALDRAGATARIDPATVAGAPVGVSPPGPPVQARRR
jgi:hypothetical protein